MDSSTPFFYAGSFMERSSISKVVYPLVIPKFVCPTCHYGEVAFQFAYPELDPSDALTKSELQRLFRNADAEPIDAEFVQRSIRLLEDRFQVPVTAGTRFGPARIAVTATPKDDFDVMPLTNEFFVRRSAAQSLCREGFDLRWVEPKASGKHAAAADFVQLVVPIVAHVTVVDGTSFCRACNRVRRLDGYKKGQTPVLIVGPEIAGLPYFKAIEASGLILTAPFIEASRRLGLRGFVFGETLFPEASIRGS